MSFWKHFGVLKYKTEPRETSMFSPIRGEERRQTGLSYAVHLLHPHSWCKFTPNLWYISSYTYMHAIFFVLLFSVFEVSFVIWHQSQKSEMKDEFSLYKYYQLLALASYFFFQTYPLSSILFPHILSEPGFKSFRVTFRPDGGQDVYLRYGSSRYSWKSNPEPVGTATSNKTCPRSSKCFAKSVTKILFGHHSEPLLSFFTVCTQSQSVTWPHAAFCCLRKHWCIVQYFSLTTVIPFSLEALPSTILPAAVWVKWGADVSFTKASLPPWISRHCVLKHALRHIRSHIQ